MKIAENIPIKLPIIKVRANPLTKLVPKLNKIKATKIIVKFPSRTDGQARLKPSSSEIRKPFPRFNSSLILEKIKILASTAMPIDKIKPAMPAKVRVTGINLNKERFKAI